MEPRNLFGSASLKFRASATLSATYGPTGRFITADSEYACVREWAEHPDPDVQERHQARQRFVDCLSRVDCVNADAMRLSCFRGRRFSNGASPTPEEMGPPPASDARANRYNKPNESTLYLSESERAVGREPISGSGQLWVQQFLLPTDQLAIADFSSLSADDFASKAFWFAELAGNAGVAVQLCFSQLLGSLVQQRFDGMRVPGVRGSNETRYSNIVVFRAEARWKSWLATDCRPVQAAPDGFV